MHLRTATPDSLGYRLDDLFERVTLRDNTVERANPPATWGRPLG
jgi:hypothetical protein